MNNELIVLWQNARAESELERLQIANDFRAVYDNDYEIIKEILYRYFQNKPFKKETLDRMMFLHVDEVKKTLRLKTAGVYEPRPLRELYKSETETYEDLETFLDEIDFHAKVKEAFIKSKFFNTVMAHPKIVDGELMIEIVTGDMCFVKPKADFLKPKAITLIRTDERGQTYYAYWDEEEHYVYNKHGQKETAPDQQGTQNPYVNNPYQISPLPFVVLRNEESRDFWGEPDWSLFLYQLYHDMTMTDNIQAEFLQKFPTLVINNAELPDGQKLGYGEVLNLISKVSGEDASADYLNPNTDWANIRENIITYREMVYNAEGIPQASASLEVSAQSGTAKTIDRLELEEQRESDIEKLIRFEVQLLNVIRMVWNENIRTNKLPDGEFYVEFSKEETAETVSDKINRRKMEKEYRIKDEIDFIMEDLGLTREEATEHFNSKLPATETVNRIDRLLNGTNA